MLLTHDKLLWVINQDSKHNTITKYEITNKIKKIKTFRAHDNIITDINKTINNNILITVSHDHTIKLWNTINCQLIGRIEMEFTSNNKDYKIITDSNNPNIFYTYLPNYIFYKWCITTLKLLDKGFLKLPISATMGIIPNTQFIYTSCGNILIVKNNKIKLYKNNCKISLVKRLLENYNSAFCNITEHIINDYMGKEYILIDEVSG